MRPNGTDVARTTRTRLAMIEYLEYIIRLIFSTTLKGHRP